MENKKFETVELEYGEIALIIEALKLQEKKVRDERFYRRDNSEDFYNMYLEKCDRLLNKLSLSTKFINVPKSMMFKG